MPEAHATGADMTLAESDEFRVEQGEDSLVHILDGKGVVRLTMDYNTWADLLHSANVRRQFQ